MSEREARLREIRAQVAAARLCERSRGDGAHLAAVRSWDRNSLDAAEDLLKMLDLAAGREAMLRELIDHQVIGEVLSALETLADRIRSLREAVPDRAESVAEAGDLVLPSEVES